MGGRLAVIDERGPGGAGQGLEWLELQNRFLRPYRDRPAARDEAVDEEGGPDLCREDHLLAEGLGQNAGPLGRRVAEDRGIEPRQESRRGDDLGGRARRAGEVDELAAPVVRESAQVLHARERRSDVRHADAAPGRDVGDGGGSESAEVPSHDELVRGRGFRRLSQFGWRGPVPAELPGVEMRPPSPPDQPPPGYPRPAAPISGPPVLPRAPWQVGREE